jgi:1,4-alpha-glucan branching enzyme
MPPGRMASAQASGMPWQPPRAAETPRSISPVLPAGWMHGFGGKWRGVQYVESHDEVYRGRGQRVARLGDGSNPRSWYARSRARVATGLVLTAPGIPMLFMGQEFLEDAQWADDPSHYPDLLLHWNGLDGGDPHMRDHLRFVSDLVRLRRGFPALRGDGLKVIVADDYNRVLAFQRWVEGEGQDVVVVASLNEGTLHGYRVGMPWTGRWREAFNSDAYDFFPTLWSPATMVRSTRSPTAITTSQRPPT